MNAMFGGKKKTSVSNAAPQSGKERVSMSNLKFPSRRPLKTDPAEVISSGQVTLSGQWMSNPDLGAPVSEGHRQEIMLMAEREANKRLQAQLNLANKRLAEVEAPPPKAEASITNAKKLQQLAQDADSATARACILAACSARDVTLPVLTALLTQLSKNAAFKIKIKLPDDEDEMKKFTARVFKLADIDRDAILNEREFALLWHNLFKLEMETILCERYNAKMVAPASTFKFGTRQEWITGLQQKLGHLITRSVEAECTTNDGGVWRKPYEYFVKERARPEHRPGDGNDVEGKPIIFDEGHEGWSLSDFHAIAQTEKADARLNKVEVAILRMYTAEFFKPWNNALRGQTDKCEDDDGEGLKQWATCIAVLFTAVIKLSSVPSRDAVTGKPITKVWRGVGEERVALPTHFFESTVENQGYPGGAEPAFSSTTTDIFTAYSYSGGWEMPGTILEIAYDAASRGADVQFLSCYPRERELLLPPFCMFSTHGFEVRGLKKFIKCSITFNPGLLELAIENFTDKPRIYNLLRRARGTTRAEQWQVEVARAFLESVREKQPDFLCPFHECVLIDPVIAEDGRTYERANIENYFQKRKAAGKAVNSPTLPAKFSPMGEKLVPNTSLKEQILAAKAQHEKMMQEADNAPLGPCWSPFSRALAATPNIGASATTAAAATASTKAALATADASEIKLSSVAELGEIFESLDSLSDFLPASLENWQTPSFVVLGSESSGKSTLLERLSMKPMFPRGEGICTRMAIKVEMRRTLNAAKPPELQVVDVKTQQPLGEKTILAAAASEHDINEVMQQQIREEHNGLVGVSNTRMLVLRVCSPSVPSLDLIDLPGLVNTRRAGEPEDMADQTKDLISSFIASHKAHAMFLVIVPAAQPPNTAPILELVQKYQIETQCIGVFTKCDDVVAKVLTKQVKERLLMTGGDSFALQQGWVATMNEPVEDEGLTARERIEKQGKDELLWFHERLGSVAGLAGKVGCNALVDTMRSAFFRYVKDTWAPAAIFQLDGEEARLCAADKDLGLPPAHKGEELQGGQGHLRQLKAAAKAAAKRVLEHNLNDDIGQAYLKAYEDGMSAASENTECIGLSGLSDWVAVRRREVHERTQFALKTAVARARERLEDDASPFRLSRLPAFIDAVEKVLDQGFDEVTDLTKPGGGLPSVDELLDRAIAQVKPGGWVETCKDERLSFDESRAAVEPAKQHIVKLLGEVDATPILKRAGLHDIAIDKWTIESEDSGWRRCIVGRSTKASIICRNASGQKIHLDPKHLAELSKSIVVHVEMDDDEGAVPTEKVKASVLWRRDGHGFDVSFCPLAGAFPSDGNVQVECNLTIALHRRTIGEKHVIQVVPDGFYDPIEKAVAALNISGSGAEKVEAAAYLREIAADTCQAERFAAITKAGAIPALVSVLKNGTTALKEDAAATLASLMYKNEANKQAIVDAQAIPVFVQLVKSGTVQLKEHCCRALCNLGNAKHRPTIVKANAIGPVVALAKDGTTEKQKEYALGALCNFTVEKAEVDAVVKENAISVLVTLQYQGPTPRHMESAKMVLDRIGKMSKDYKRKIDAATSKHLAKNYAIVHVNQRQKCRECGCKELVNDSDEDN